MSEQQNTSVTEEIERVFSAPTEELVRHATRDLEYAERLTVHKMSAGIGNHPIDIYSFQLAISTIFGTKWDRLFSEGSKPEIVWFDPGTLVAWLRDAIGDVELAQAIAEAMAGQDHLKARVDAILPLFVERVEQYRAVLETADAG